MYKEAGEYVVTLTVYGADGNGKLDQTDHCRQGRQSGALGILHVYYPETVVVDTEVTFTDASVVPMARSSPAGGPFPDNTTSTEASVKYTFTKGGTFDVTLQVTDDRGASSEVSKKIFVAGDEGIGSRRRERPVADSAADRWNEIAQSINGTRAGRL